MKLKIKQELNLGGNKYISGDIVDVSESLGINLLSHKPESYGVDVESKPIVIKKEINLDINNDGVVDSKDVSLAAKVLKKASSLIKKKPAKKRSK